MTRKIIRGEPPKIMFDPSKLKLVDPKSLTLDPKNRNKHSPEQIDRLVKLYRKFGMRWPVLVSEQTGLVKAGEGRLLAAMKCGMPQVLVSYQEFEDAETEYAFGISDNAIASWAELDITEINTDLPQFSGMDIEILGIEDLYQVGSHVRQADSSDEAVEEINKGDENAEWVGMPEFESGEKYVNLTYQFKTEEDRENYCKEHGIEIDKKMSGQWIVYK